MSKLLIDDSPLQVLPKLAIRIGLNEAIFLQQLHWLTKDKRPDAEGKQWIRKTYTQWKKEVFPFWSTRTIERTANSVAKLNLVIIEQRDKSNRNRDNFYAIDRVFFGTWESGSESSGGIDHDKVAASEPANLADSDHVKVADSYKDQSLKQDEEEKTAVARAYKPVTVFSIDDVKDPTAFIDTGIMEFMVDLHPDLSFRDYFRKWWLSRKANGGIGRRPRKTAPLADYTADIEAFFQNCADRVGSGSNGNGHKKNDDDRPIWMASKK